jgi:uncharacterized MAPEG superfamily protein
LGIKKGNQLIELILLSLLLLLAHLVLPSILAVIAGNVSADFLLGPRDESPALSQVCQRAQRASANLLETLPVFLVLAVLSILTESDVIMLAQVWLLLRVLYLFAYLSAVAYLRSLIWMGALACLIGMSLPLF